MNDEFGARSTIHFAGNSAAIYRLDRLSQAGIGTSDRLPFSIKVLLENALRNQDGRHFHAEDVVNLAGWDAQNHQAVEIPFSPARVILQDFTGVPSLVDLAALRSAMQRMGGDPQKINPQVPVDLVIDHSVQVDVFGSADAILRNAEMEFIRNRERYEFLHWGQKAFENLKVVPPATGIVHQVNLEYLANVVQLNTDAQGDGVVALPDSLVGTDSHTTMINGLGVLGWGVGGIEAEAAMLGQPIYMLMPEVIGFKLVGELPEGATATDLVLVVTQMLRAKGVVGKFVEFYGPGLSSMSLPDRATIANMAPEYGATVGFFPVDDETLSYLRRTARDEDLVSLVEVYCKEQGLFRSDSLPDPVYNDSLELDLGAVEASVAGPLRPQDRILVRDLKPTFKKTLAAPLGPQGFALDAEQLNASGSYQSNGDSAELTHGSVVIAAITSCTNTSNPSVMVAAGLLAKSAALKGLRRKPYVKTSLAPGSKVVTEYLDKAGLTPHLEALGFHTVGYGCTTCIGNSGPLPEAVRAAIHESDLVAASVLSGNRNFGGRIGPDVRANFLASPPLVVAYALAGTVDIDLNKEPLGQDGQGEAVYLRDIWPSQAEILATVQNSLDAGMYAEQYADVYDGNEQWNAIPSADAPVYAWDKASTYIQEPPFFVDLPREPAPITAIEGARVMVKGGDSVTTDHISPAGAIAINGPAGQYLLDRDVSPQYFNSFGSRRGNDRVMTRGTFANVRLRNLLVPGSEGGRSYFLPTGEEMSIYEAALRYKEDGTPLIVLAGKDYGMGSSRDWAAKGTLLLGIRAVIAESIERIHRSNLVMMGVLPLTFAAGESYTSLGLTGHETFDIPITDVVKPMQTLKVTATDASGAKKQFEVAVRLDTPVEVDYYRHGGILHLVLRNFLAE
ncbi:MAG: aconitate hydratase AcnA [Chloroflexi bacterium]|nr:aconitate hydratase AcnA [Chloroflexota bacterium]MCY3582012.1 aconitate hydratase AcnA [Chloroflexota bacterium]MCY3716529.1 aconitate hydratase AcnA [Chloroflexota bacterium]MDE2651638.1 aconitate hydratase AcnA [Chloroflexota bacterium]MXV92702.1 aconitate hydratase AcnA [Chloroflexota bacterium]